MLSAWQKEQAECAKKISEYKLASEANIVASMFKNPELIYDSDLKLEDFSNNIWKVWWNIATSLVLKENKTALDEITVGIYLDKHPKLKAKVEEYGGYSVIHDAQSYINLDNYDGYVGEIKKWNVVLELLKYGFPVSEKLSEYADKTVDEIYEELELYLNHIFISADSGVQSYNIFDNVDEYIDDLNSGSEIGMPFYNSDILNNEIGGWHRGHITSIGASTGCGKSNLVFNYIFQSAIDYNEPVVVVINEEDQKRWVREALIHVANNILHKELNKYTLRNGHFSNKTMQTLREAAQWMQEKKDKHLITVIPLTTYNVDTMIKIIKKYSSSMNVNYFCLDTFKESANAGKDEGFKAMLRDSIKLYDCIKPANRNVALLLTMQLNKGALKSRKLSASDIGISKNIVDVFSVNLLFRRANADEYEGEKNALKCFRVEGKNKIPFSLEKGKQYLICTIDKNRFGMARHYEVVCEVDYGTNYFKERGYTIILEDF